VSTLRHPAERALHEAVVTAAGKLADDSGQDLAEFVGIAGSLVGPIETFFNEVLVMDQNRELRAARMGLLARIGELGDRMLDFSAM
ncbi:MAG: hypothetical protein ACRDQZ_25350, partial [Mycobacteriales bacterium]